jgi:subtilase family serine protease
MGQIVQRDTATGKWKKAASAGGIPKSPRPQFATTDQYGDIIEDVGPWDFAAIYNLTPLWNATTPIDGTGQTIAIAGTSDINIADVNAFRQDFDLPTSGAANTPQQMKGVNGKDPGECAGSSGVCTIDDLIENSLDVEWSGSIAKNAQIILVTSGS